MSTKEDSTSLVDDTKPNIGRIYDYFLGGNHNFEVDRIQAEKILEKMPLAPKMCRMVRWFLGEAVRRLVKDGYTQFIDFAAGLPLQDHIHQIAPEGSKIIYSDNDPITVAFSSEIVGDNPNVLYLSCDVKNPSEILDSAAAAKLLDRTKKTAVGMNGITYFMDEDAIKKSLGIIYDWAQKGDRLYLCDSNGSFASESDRAVYEMYEKMGTPFYMHSVEKMEQLAGGWKPVSPGYRLLEDWLGTSGSPLSFSVEEKDSHGGNYYGVIFEK